jgi:hypothetical protein
MVKILTEDGDFFTAKAQRAQRESFFALSLRR